MGIIVILLFLAAIYGFIASHNQKKEQQTKMSKLEASLEEINPSFEYKHGGLSILYDKDKRTLRVKYVLEDIVSVKDIHDVDVKDITEPSEISPIAWIITNGLDNSLIYIISDKECYHIVKGFKPTKIFSDAFSYLAIDMDSKQIVSVYNEIKRGILFNSFKFSDIIKVELSENGHVVSSKSTARTIGGAIVGNVIAGGAGMIVGGLSGDSKLKDKIDRIIIRIILNNIEKTQVEYMIWLGAINGVSKNDERYTKALKRAQEIENIIGIIINECDTKEKHVEKATISLADELKKLAELRDSGILTEEEFAEQKAKILKS